MSRHATGDRRNGDEQAEYPVKSETVMDLAPSTPSLRQVTAPLPAPHLELFARNARPDWTGWGDEAGTDVEPRGQIHRGYEGGPLLQDTLDAATVTDAYAAGRSIREISETTGLSIRRVRQSLTETNTPLRGRGRPASEITA